MNAPSMAVAPNLDQMLGNSGACCARGEWDLEGGAAGLAAGLAGKGVWQLKQRVLDAGFCQLHFGHCMVDILFWMLPRCDPAAAEVRQFIENPDAFRAGRVQG